MSRPGQPRQQAIARGMTILVVAVGALAGCSKSGAKTCTEYAAEEYTKQTTTIMSMVKEHDLDPLSNAVGVAAIAVDVNEFCGISGLPGDTSPPTKNADQPIEDAVSWDSYRAD